MSPEQSLQALLDLSGTHFFGMHWGAYDLSDEPVDAGPRLARQVAPRRGDRRRAASHRAARWIHRAARRARPHTGHGAAPLRAGLKRCGGRRSGRTHRMRLTSKSILHEQPIPPDVRTRGKRARRSSTRSQSQPAPGLVGRPSHRQVVRRHRGRHRRARQCRRREQDRPHHPVRLSARGLLSLGARGHPHLAHGAERRRRQQRAHRQGQGGGPHAARRARPQQLHRLVQGRRPDGRQVRRLRRAVAALQRRARAPLRVHAVRARRREPRAQPWLHGGRRDQGHRGSRTRRVQPDRHIHPQPLAR